MSQKSQNTSILVLGGAGRLGRQLRAFWRATPPGCGPVAFQARGPGGDLVWAPGQPMGALPRADTVVALWGVTAGTPAELAANSALAEAARAVARHCRARRLLHFSSAAVYGPAARAREEDPPAPVGAYGAAKLEMERRVAGFDDDGLAHCCLRLANVVGADSLAPALRAPGPVVLDRFADGAGPLRSYIGGAGNRCASRPGPRGAARSVERGRAPAGGDGRAGARRGPADRLARRP